MAILYLYVFTLKFWHMSSFMTSSLSFKKVLSAEMNILYPFAINSSYLIPFFHSDPMDHVVNKLMWLE